MPDEKTLDAVDRDGAIRETADRVRGDRRADLLRRAAVATGGMVGGAAAIMAIPGVAGAQSRRDRDILNFALTLEELEAAFYAQALERAGLTGPVLEFARTVAVHEASHVKSLRGVLGSSAIARPTFDFKDTTTDGTKFLATAIALEDTGVRAYKGQAPRIQSTAVLKAALAIHSVEARHAAWVRTFVAGQNPVPFPVEPPRSMSATLEVVRDTGFIVS
ncbi:ferritin-like domain-containing protein [Conexibacter sp. SYSU D00693]|uniref:ferritin-like domain-containing protein n=1 Tax=Conexibacter sp. SYSU D00693 TaxID=2812560 RepID=UPI00196ABCB8|nr:ferritin-like domain-containing protein [Conexibacter sp. SYSU D00693]